MRIAGVLIIWAVIAGGLFLYKETRYSHGETTEAVAATVKATASVTIEVTATFTAEQDPFSLDVADDGGGSPFILRLGTQVLFDDADALQPGVPLITDALTDLNAGMHELYIDASPPLDNAAASHAVRLRAFESGRLIAEKTFWSEPGGKISGTLQFELIAEETGEAHDH